MRIRTALAFLMVSMFLLPMVGSVVGETLTTFSDGSPTKTVAFAPGGGDFTDASITLPKGAVVRDLSMTLTPETVEYNESIDLPGDEPFTLGSYDEDDIVADHKGVKLRGYKFTYRDSFTDYSGIDNASTTANVLIEEGLTGIAIAANTTDNVTDVGETTHGPNSKKLFAYDGRLIKAMVINATGSVPFGTIRATVRAWNVNTQMWDMLVNNIDIGDSPDHVSLVDQAYPSPVYSKVDAGLRPTVVWGNMDMWLDHNLTVQTFMDTSTVTSAPIYAVDEGGWDQADEIHSCYVDPTTSIPADTDISFFISPNNGTNWEVVGSKDHLFATTGNVLRWRAVLSTTNNNTTSKIDGVKFVCKKKITNAADYTSREFALYEGAYTSFQITWKEDLEPLSDLSVHYTVDGIPTEVTSGETVGLSHLYGFNSTTISISLTTTNSSIPALRTMRFNFSVAVDPVDVGVDVGDDGIFEYSFMGAMDTAVVIEGMIADSFIHTINSMISPDGGMVKFRVHCGSQGIVTMSDLSVVYGMPPELIGPIGLINMTENTDLLDALVLDDHFTDDYDDGDLNYEIVYIEEPGEISPVLVSGKVSIYLLEGWYGVSSFRVRATDSDGSWVESNNVTVVVNGVNDPPVIISSPDGMKAFVGVDFIGMVEAYDPEGDMLTYEMVEGPGIADLDPATGLIRWTPTAEGNFSFKVNVTDGDLTVMAQFNIIVERDDSLINGPFFVTAPGLKATVEVLYTYEADAEDLDGDEITFVLLEGPQGMHVNSTSGKLTWVPSSSQLGYNRAVIQVTDGYFFAEQSFKILVLNTVGSNTKPTIMSAPNGNAWAGMTYTYDVNVSDPDVGTVITYNLLAGAPGMVMDDDGHLYWTPTEDDIGDHVIQISVSDGLLTVQQSWTLTVHGRTRNCVISTPADGVTVGTKVKIEGLASAPGNLTKVEVRVGSGDWKQVKGMENWSHEANLAGMKAGTYEIRARACDNITCSKEAVVRIKYEGDGISGGLSGAWIALIIVVVLVIILLILDLKMRFIRPPRPKKKGRGKGRKRRR